MSTNGPVSQIVLSEVSRTYERPVFSLIAGLIIGVFMAKIFELSTLNTLESMLYAAHSHKILYGPEKDFDTHNHIDENSTVALKLYNETRVLCWIMTNPKNHKTKARHIKRTWGKRCNKLLFMSSKKDSELNSIALNVSRGRNNLWAKTKAAFSYIHRHHFDEADWFLKVDDETYVIMENLRYLLYSYSPETPIYFGCKLKPHVKQGYMSGDAGYVLSKEAVRRFVVDGLTNSKLCNDSASGAEDVEIGKCLENINVTAGDSRDEYERGRFFPFMPDYHLNLTKRNSNFWFLKQIYYQTGEGLECCSDYAISFHKVSPSQMYVLEYFIYHVKPYGIARGHADLPERHNLIATKAKPNTEKTFNVV